MVGRREPARAAGADQVVGAGDRRRRRCRRCRWRPPLAGVAGDDRVGQRDAGVRYPGRCNCRGRRRRCGGGVAADRAGDEGRICRPDSQRCRPPDAAELPLIVQSVSVAVPSRSRPPPWDRPGGVAADRDAGQRHGASAGHPAAVPTGVELLLTMQSVSVAVPPDMTGRRRHARNWPLIVQSVIDVATSATRRRRTVAVRQPAVTPDCLGWRNQRTAGRRRHMPRPSGVTADHAVGQIRRVAIDSQGTSCRVVAERRSPSCVNTPRKFRMAPSALSESCR